MAGEILSIEPTLAVQTAEVTGGLIVGALAATAYGMSPLSDRGSHIFPTPDEDAFAAVLDVHRVSGVRPVRDISDAHVVRALMSDKSIVNYTVNEELRAKLANVGGSRVFKSRKPYDAVRRAQDVLVSHEFDAELVKVEVPTEHADREQDENNVDVHLLLSTAFPNGVIGYRYPILRMMLRDGPSSRPPKWDNTKYRSALD